MTLLPLLFLGLLVFQLDRMNLASALTAGFATDIGINQATINFGNQVLTFGLIATLQCQVKNRTGFLLVRSFLGLAESGYIPGSIYTLSTWYTQKERARRVAIFFFGMFGGNAIGPLLASGLIKLDGKGGLKGWQWIFLLEGLFTILVSLLILLFLPGSPEHPSPLLSKGLVHISPSEGQILQQRIAAETPCAAYRPQHLRISPSTVLKTMSNWRRWPHFLATSLVFSTWSPLTTYTPTIIMKLGFSRVEANALASVGALLALLVVFVFAAVSDKTGRRGGVVAAAIGCYLVTLIVLRTTEEHVGKWSQWGLWTAVNAFAVGYHPAHNTWLQLNCHGPEERSIGIALWVMSANIGMMYGTQYFQAADQPLYHTGLTTMLGVAGGGAVLVLLQEAIYWGWNRHACHARLGAGREIPDRMYVL
ncbi:hypothetical protein QTJ16_006957 [Diplocarpon rosae]|uniref:Major facilitator superfamily (MFS) profile domain-containing protein n=1 Tax=Diplocarpon rosae TaxID=946125 RepID=A0AAD9WBY3_9HELO|nr:hypothetical protein QTJ16_006957 [Diplocarpon rosae]